MPSFVVAESPQGNISQAPQGAAFNNNSIPQVLLATSGLLTIIIIALIIYSKFEVKKLKKCIRFEQFRT